jgi:3-deoxy-7-phosphoheptulonate synthase
MLESFLLAGKQEPGPPATLAYGQSVTDACMDFDTTAAVLDGLAAAVRSRRSSSFSTERTVANPARQLITAAEAAG